MFVHSATSGGWVCFLVDMCTRAAKVPQKIRVTVW